MYARSTAPRTIGGVIDDGIRLYRAAFARSWPVALLAQLFLAVPALILRFKIGGVQIAAGNPQAMLAIFKSPSVWLAYLVLVIGFFGFYNAIIALLEAAAESRDQSFGQSLGIGFRLLPRSVLLILTMGFAFFLAALVVGLVAGFLSGLLRTLASTVAAAIPFVIFGAVLIYVWGRVFLANVALVVEDEGVFKALSISWGLIGNHWWRTATVYAVALIILIVFYVILAVISSVLLGVTMGSAFGTGAVISQLISMAGGTVLMPLIPAVLLTTYHDLKLRKEGTDLAGRVKALASI